MGWIIGCHPSEDGDSMVIWCRTPRDVVRLESPLRATFMVRAPRDDAGRLERRLSASGVAYRETSARLELGGRRERVLEVMPRDNLGLQDLARTVDRWGRHHTYSLYNVDLRMDQRLHMRDRTFPFGLMEIDDMSMRDSRYRLDYPVPPLRTCDLGFRIDSRMPTHDDSLLQVDVGDVTLDGDEVSILEDLTACIDELDPDVIRTTGGDRFYMPYLMERASRNGVKVRLGREDGVRCTGGRSYHTYGRIVYRPPAHKLPGRIHIDRDSFMYSEGGLHGLIELSRLSGIDLQDLSRMSPGSAISAMQVDRALSTGHVVQWRKNRPEDFKTASDLVTSDRGGMILQPRVGAHGDVTEVDFSSLYPSIMVRYNISPETLLCRCCPRSSIVVPELGYHICERRRGLLSDVLQPIVQRRRAFKRMRDEIPSRSAMYDQRAKLLKWVLVTCFGYTGYKNARYGRIECHEAITAYGREILIRTKEMAEERGLRALHGIVDSLWLQGDGDVPQLCEDVESEFGIPLEIEGRYRWIVFLPCRTTGAGALNRYYGVLDDGGHKVRGIALRRRDSVTFVRDLQRGMMDALARAGTVDELPRTVPAAKEVLSDSVRELRSGDVDPERLVITRRVSRPLSSYRQFNDSVAAMRQLADRGMDVHPGESVRYVVRDHWSRDPWERVTPLQMLDGDGTYDAESYVALAVRAAGEMLSPFGWDADRLMRE